MDKLVLTIIWKTLALALYSCVFRENPASLRNKTLIKVFRRHETHTHIHIRKGNMTGEYIERRYSFLFFVVVKTAKVVCERELCASEAKTRQPLRERCYFSIIIIIIIVKLFCLFSFFFAKKNI